MDSSRNDKINLLFQRILATNSSAAWTLLSQMRPTVTELRASLSSLGSDCSKLLDLAFLYSDSSLQKHLITAINIGRDNIKASFLAALQDGTYEEFLDGLSIMDMCEIEKSLGIYTEKGIVTPQSRVYFGILEDSIARAFDGLFKDDMEAAKNAITKCVYPQYKSILSRHFKIRFGECLATDKKI